MAQSPTYFGLRRGSTKTQTFSILNGKQITKDRQIGGRNPQTPEQMTQRMVMATVSAAYAQMKRIVDHSFEGVTYGGQTMAEFIKVNAAALRANIANAGEDFAYNSYRDRALYPGKYIMSRGVAASLNVATDNGGKGLRCIIYGASALGPEVMILQQSSTADMTADALLADMGCKVGDMATACILFTTRDIEGYAFTFLRIHCLKAGSVALTSANINEYFKFESDYPVSVDVASHSVGIDLNIPRFSADIPGAYCFIHSLKTATGWLRSNETLAFEANIDVSPTAEQALDTYPLGPSYILNGGQV